MTNDGTAQLQIDIDDSQLSNDDRMALASTLAEQILSLPGVLSVAPRKEVAPGGTRPIEGFTWGALLVGLAAGTFSVTLAEIVRTMREWAKRPGATRVKISVQIDDDAGSGFDPDTIAAQELAILEARLDHQSKRDRTGPQGT